MTEYEYNNLDINEIYLVELSQESKEMYSEEAVLVDREFVLREDTYNLTEGGYGGSITASIKGGKSRGKVAGYEFYKNNIGIFSERAKENLHKWIVSDEFLKMSLENIKKIAESKEIRAKIKATMKRNKHSQGSRNSQYGTMWITDGKENKKINKDEELPRGFKKGRIQKIK